MIGCACRTLLPPRRHGLALIGRSSSNNTHFRSRGKAAKNGVPIQSCFACKVIAFRPFVLGRCEGTPLLSLLAEMRRQLRQQMTQSRWFKFLLSDSALAGMSDRAGRTDAMPQLRET